MMTTTANDKPLAAEGPFHPGWVARLVIGATLSFVIAIRWLGQMADPPKPLNDPAMRNLLTLIFSFIALLTAWIWICYRSGFPLLTRRLVFFGSFAAIGVGFGAFRFVEFSGSMVPRFAPRWSAAKPEQNLGKLESNSASAPIDLASTSP